MRRRTSFLSPLFTHGNFLSLRLRQRLEKTKVNWPIFPSLHYIPFLEMNIPISCNLPSSCANCTLDGRTAEDLTATSRRLARYEALLAEILPMVSTEVRELIEDARDQVGIRINRFALHQLCSQIIRTLPTQMALKPTKRSKDTLRYPPSHPSRQCRAQAADYYFHYLFRALLLQFPRESHPVPGHLTRSHLPQLSQLPPARLPHLASLHLNPDLRSMRVCYPDCRQSHLMANLSTPIRESFHLRSCND